MPIISISRDSYSHGKAIAESVAQRLGYAPLGAQAIQRQVNEYNLAERRFERALAQGTASAAAAVSSKERQLALFRAAFYEALAEDDIVYHGVAGHIFLAGLPGVYKVRIVADLEDRIREEMAREKMGYDEAKAHLRRLDAERARWTKELFGGEHHEPSLYDLYLNLHNIDVVKAVNIIVESFRIALTGRSDLMRSMLRDRGLAARVEASLLSACSAVSVTATEGDVEITMPQSPTQETLPLEELRYLASSVPGVGEVRVSAPAFEHLAN